MPDMYWLQKNPDFKQTLAKTSGSEGWPTVLELANSQLDFLQTIQLDKRAAKLNRGSAFDALNLTPLKIAILSSSTVDQLFPGIRIAGLRRKFDVSLYATSFGQYAQELVDPGSKLHAFKPDVVLFSLDQPHLIGSTIDAPAAAETAIERLKDLWRLARSNFNCQVVQQTLLPTALPLMGGNDQRLPGSPGQLTYALNAGLRAASEEEKVDLLTIDERAAIDGLNAWHDPILWLRAKQAIAPAAGAFYGELLMRLVGAQRGRSAKCLVLDLDNTLWGGVIGDDGMNGIVLGQGNAVGEAYVQLQTYAANLAKRGVLLAVCSKNDEKNALEPFASHPEMVIKRADISCFMANWDDKPTNLRRIAESLNIGLDSLVFVDDNPFERNIVRRELPMVQAPELPDDPGLYARCLADAGYFEAVAITQEDLSRTELYQARAEREALAASTTDLAGYLRSLEMRMTATPFDDLGLKRITQLANKTNQFNLTTRRYTEAEISGAMADRDKLTLQVRLADKFGDHGIIALLIGGMQAEGQLDIETWLMSCRVLGRGVEQACFNVLASEAVAMGARAMKGRYIPTAKNGMVEDHYGKLGFSQLSSGKSGETIWAYDLSAFDPIHTDIAINGASHD
jgi:FkbH-like protein